MRSNALKKEEYSEEDFQAAETWETVRLRIAKVAEEACNMPANNNAPDFDAFEEKYGEMFA